MSFLNCTFLLIVLINNITALNPPSGNGYNLWLTRACNSNTVGQSIADNSNQVNPNQNNNAFLNEARIHLENAIQSHRQ